MKNLIEQLENHLSSISDEQFLQEWAEIDALGMQGPDAEHHAISLLRKPFAITQNYNEIIVTPVYTPSVINSAEAKFKTDSIGNYQYAMAA